MELLHFFDLVEAHPNLEGLGIDGECADHRPGLLVRHKNTGLITRLPAAAVEAAEWSILEEVLTGRREPQVLQYMTRVVGYFSRVENWNKSKIGELRDRQRGNYAVAG